MNGALLMLHIQACQQIIKNSDSYGYSSNIGYSSRGSSVVAKGRMSKSDEAARRMAHKRAEDDFNEQPRGWMHPEPLPLSHFISYYEREMGVRE